MIVKLCNIHQRNSGLKSLKTRRHANFEFTNMDEGGTGFSRGNVGQREDSYFMLIDFVFYAAQHVGISKVTKYQPASPIFRKNKSSTFTSPNLI